MTPNGRYTTCDNCGCVVPSSSSARVLCGECRVRTKRSRQWFTKPTVSYTVVQSGAGGECAFRPGVVFGNADVREMCRYGSLDLGMILESRGHRYIAVADGNEHNPSRQALRILRE